MLQRLGLATALLGDPQVLVLDEPANGLDPQGVHWLRGFLRQLADQGRTVLVSSHVLAEVAQTVDQVVILAGGRLVTQAPLAALTDQARGAVRVRSADTGALRDLLAAHGATVELAGPDELVASGVTSQQVGRMAAAAGIAIYEMGFERANLEEVFLQLTAPQGGTS
jgi:ABC-2 type transport system ATP-binding protein